MTPQADFVKDGKVSQQWMRWLHTVSPAGGGDPPPDPSRLQDWFGRIPGLPSPPTESMLEGNRVTHTWLRYFHEVGKAAGGK